MTQTAGWYLVQTLPGTCFEVVVMITVESTQFAIHAMPMREKYRRLLER
ncbi:MAG TPA: hypothetical protein VMB51_15555 [Solirubrobacteraceae bacterium]|nr:hypothetical protein [Solirubrobacteraceae bacterium]